MPRSGAAVRAFPSYRVCVATSTRVDVDLLPEHPSPEANRNQSNSPQFVLSRAQATVSLAHAPNNSCVNAPTYTCATPTTTAPVPTCFFRASSCSVGVGNDRLANARMRPGQLRDNSRPKQQEGRGGEVDPDRQQPQNRQSCQQERGHPDEGCPIHPYTDCTAKRE